MRDVRATIWVMVIILPVANIASGDTFGTGDNQFTIDFVDVSGDSGDLGSWSAGSGYTFSGVNHGDYRMGTYEITNDQWNKFKASYGTVTGSPSSAYNSNPDYTGDDVPTNRLSWYEGAQFVNYLNTSTGHQAAYKFMGTQGTGDYTWGVWESGDAGYDADNPYRNSNAYYFLPTEDEWVKAAYWNGTSLQTYATKAGESLTQGDGTSGTGWNYWDQEHFPHPLGPWDVGSGSEELNGTFDMMGNVWEWTESPWSSGDYLSGSRRSLRGGSFVNGNDHVLRSSYRFTIGPLYREYASVGFRVASVPEPVMINLDIKPQSCPNPLNVKSKGVLPVAILGSDSFDVGDIDIASIRLEGVAPTMSAYEDAASPVLDQTECSCTTDGPDGYMDLTLKFKTQEIMAVLGEVHDGEVWLLYLTGLLYDGTEIEGSDCVQIIKKGK